MYEYDQLMTELEEMRSRFDSGFSTSDKALIKQLYSDLLNKTPRRAGCMDCYRDAYLEIYVYLKKARKMPKKPNYTLKAGCIIHPAGTNKYYGNNNVPDDVAEEHLAQFPKSIVDFQSYPADYLERVAARKEGRAVEGNSTEALKAKIKELEETVASLTAEKDAETTLTDSSEFVMEIETLKADLLSEQEKNKQLEAKCEELTKEVASLTAKKRTTKKAAATDESAGEPAKDE